MKYLQARERATEFFFCVHLDESKMIEDPDDSVPLIRDPANPEKQILDPSYVLRQIPDPEWCRDYSFGKDLKMANIEKEIGLSARAALVTQNVLAAHEDGRMARGETKLDIEGGAL